MAVQVPQSDSDRDALRQDLREEYSSLLRIVTDFDQRLMAVKGWSVTLSLASLGLGFQQGHYALFALAAGSALAFWFIEITVKGHQLRYYSRMRDIEVAAFHLNHVTLDELSEVSAPRIDMYWPFNGFTPREVAKARARNEEEPRDWRTDKPIRRTPEELRDLLRRPYRMSHVMLPHVVAVVLGLGLFICSVANVPGLAQLAP